MTTTTLHVKGMSCQNCVRHVREAIEGVSGVSQARVDLDKAEAVIKWRASQPSETELLKALDDAGYPSRVLKEPANGKSVSAGSGWKFNVVLGSAVTLPLMVAEWGCGLGHQSWFVWVSFLLVLPVQALCGARFYRGAWQQLKVGSIQHGYPRCPRIVGSFSVQHLRPLLPCQGRTYLFHGGGCDHHFD